MSVINISPVLSRTHLIQYCEQCAHLLPEAMWKAPDKLRSSPDLPITISPEHMVSPNQSYTGPTVCHLLAQENGQRFLTQTLPGAREIIPRRVCLQSNNPLNLYIFLKRRVSIFE